MSRLQDCTSFSSKTCYGLVNRDPCMLCPCFIYHLPKFITDYDPKFFKYPSSNTGSVICDFTNINVTYRCSSYYLKSMPTNFNKRYGIGTKPFCHYGIISVRVFVLCCVTWKCSDSVCILLYLSIYFG